MKIDFISSHHKKTKRNYLERVINIDKAKAATIAPTIITEEIALVTDIKGV